MRMVWPDVEMIVLLAKEAGGLWLPHSSRWKDPLSEQFDDIVSCDDFSKAEHPEY